MTREPRHGRTNLPQRSKDQLDALLDGDVSGDPRLDAVVSAAREPGRAHELQSPPPHLADLGGPDTAPAGTGTRRRVLTRFAAATLLTKAVVGVAGAVVIGAAAVAGATGHLPGQHRHAPAPITTTGASARPSSDASTGASRSASRSASSSTTTGAPSATGSPSSTGASGSTATPDLVGLCRQWLALPPGPGGAKDSPRFTVLVQTAGGSGRVTGFCRLKVSASPSGPTSTRGSSTSRPTPTPPARRSPSATVSVSGGN